MLVLTRNLKESITLFIGDTEVKVIFAEQRTHNKVRLAFDCPDYVIIKRDEIIEHPDAKSEARAESFRLMKAFHKRAASEKRMNQQLERGRES